MNILNNVNNMFPMDLMDILDHVDDIINMNHVDIMDSMINMGIVNNMFNMNNMNKENMMFTMNSMNILNTMNTMNNMNIFKKIPEVPEKILSLSSETIYRKPMKDISQEKPKQGRQKAVGRIDPAIELALRNIRESQVGEIDPYSMTTKGIEDDMGQKEAPADKLTAEGAGGVTVKGGRDDGAGGKDAGAASTAPRRGRGRPRKGDAAAGGSAVAGSYMYVSAERKRTLETLLMCYRLGTGKRVTMSDFVLRYVEKGLEAEDPKVMSLYRKFVKASE